MRLFKLQQPILSTLIITAILLSTQLNTIAQVAKPVDIPDPQLHAVIEVALGKNPGSVITEVDMEH